MRSLNSTVRLNPAQSRKLMERMGSDPVFSSRLREKLHAKDETALARFLKKSGFVLRKGGD